MKKIFILLFLVLSLVVIGGCGKKEDITYLDTFHSPAQAAYINDNYNLFTKYAKGTEELSRPVGNVISWDKIDGAKYIVNVSESSQMTDSLTFETEDNQITLYNLKTNTKYYVEVKANEEVITKKIYMVKTNGPRNLYIDGVTNARDIGGYKTSNGKIVKQGLLYRTARFSENETNELLITDAGIKTLTEQLKLKTELDLRKTEDNENGGLTKSVVGETVNYISIPMNTGGNYLLINKKTIPNVFNVLANKDNYPIAFHCSIGTDRTGVIAFLINGLLGVSEEDLYRDYLFSNFGNIDGMRNANTIKNYLEVIKREDGKNLAEQFNNYLLSLDISQDTLNAVKKIMLG